MFRCFVKIQTKPVASTADVGLLPAQVLAATFACVALGSSVGSAQAILLPQFEASELSTAVLVPDRGGVVLGGIGEGRSLETISSMPGTITPGLTSRGSGQARGGSTMSVHAFVHDFEAMDAAIVAGDSSPSQQQSRLFVANANQLQSFAEEVAAIRSAAVTPEAGRSAAAKAYLNRGKQKLAAGSPRLATSWLNAAIREGDEPTRNEASTLVKAVAKAVHHEGKQQEEVGRKVRPS